MAHGLNPDAKAIVSRLSSINKKLCCLTGNSTSCGCDCNGLDVNVDFGEVTALLEGIIDAINDITFEFPEGTVFPTKDVLCNADCQSVICFTTFNPDGTVASMVHVLPDGSPYTGDLNALDPTCSKCGEPTPTYQIFTKDVCFEDCSKGCIIYKINTTTDEITPISTLDASGNPTDLPTSPCTDIITLKNADCVPNISIPDDVEFIPLKDCPK